MDQKEKIKCICEYDRGKGKNRVWKKREFNILESRIKYESDEDDEQFSRTEKQLGGAECGIVFFSLILLQLEVNA